ncbi:sugar phosphate isomerase/epimerase [bacterium]|jgi:sugar phosphate isomerase/epimerase|nr:sugar phosphate isomerase/epimerase [bacterium]
MQFGICNETFKDWPFDKAFAYAKDLGYTGIEIAPFTIDKDVRKISPAKRSEVKELAAKFGLEVIGLHWLLAFTEGFYLTTPDASIQNATTNYLKSLADLCGDLGGKVMVLGSPQQRNLLPDVSLEQATEIAAKVIGDAAAAFADNNVTLAIEPLGPEEGDFLLTADLGIDLAKRIDHPNVKLHLDVKAMSAETKPIPQIIRDSRDYVVHFHANDPNKRGPGMGEVDFAPIFEALREINYENWVSVEVFDYEPGIENLASKSIEYMKKFV